MQFIQDPRYPGWTEHIHGLQPAAPTRRAPPNLGKMIRHHWSCSSTSQWACRRHTEEHWSAEQEVSNSNSPPISPVASHHIKPTPGFKAVMSCLYRESTIEPAPPMMAALSMTQIMHHCATGEMYINTLTTSVRRVTLCGTQIVANFYQETVLTLLKHLEPCTLVEDGGCRNHWMVTSTYTYITIGNSHLYLIYHWWLPSILILTLVMLTQTCHCLILVVKLIHCYITQVVIMIRFMCHGGCLHVFEVIIYFGQSIYSLPYQISCLTSKVLLCVFILFYCQICYCSACLFLHCCTYFYMYLCSRWVFILKEHEKLSITTVIFFRS